MYLFFTAIPSTETLGDLRLKQNTCRTGVEINKGLKSPIRFALTAIYPNKNLNVSVLGIPVTNLSSDSRVVCANLNQG